MKRAILIILLAAVRASITNGTTAEAGSVRYSMSDASYVEVGCHDQCACPVVQRSLLGGGFTLISQGFDGLYHHYDVENLRWRVPIGASEVEVAGRGHYRVGGEVALQHQLTLDLAFDGNDPKRYDSGLVPGGNGFPDIDIYIADLVPACFDTTFQVRAKPIDPASVDPATPRIVELGVAPNPFQGSTSMLFSLRGDAPIEIVVFDLTGRMVRVLERSRLGEAGRHRITWDGRDRSGAIVPAGLYLVRLRSRTEALWRTVAKLE